MISLLLFEDATVSNLLPLTWTRPVWDLRCGAWTLREAIEDAYSAHVTHLYTREHLADVTREWRRMPVNEAPNSGMVLCLNGRLLADRTLPRHIPMVGDPCRYLSQDGVLLGAWVPAERLQNGWDAIETLPVRNVEMPVLAWPWDLITHNGARIAAQSRRYALGEVPDVRGVHLIEREKIFVHPTATVQPGVVLNASEGPIVIDAKSVIMSNAVIQGPVYVGPSSTVKVAGQLYHGTSVGPVCKVGGEVEETIIQGYSNKQHDGFLGHSYIGEWCNLGAGTITSDLKNNYGAVTMWVNGEYVDTGSIFLGLFMAAHSKVAINSVFNAGTVVGVGCNLFGVGFPPKYVPSFSWGGAQGLTEHRLPDAVATAERVMARRKMTLSDNERRMLEHIFRATTSNRMT